MKGLGLTFRFSRLLTTGGEVLSETLTRRTRAAPYMAAIAEAGGVAYTNLRKPFQGGTERAPAPSRMYMVSLLKTRN